MKGFATVLDTSLHHDEGEQGCLVAFTHCVLQPVSIVYEEDHGFVFEDDGGIFYEQDVGIVYEQEDNNENENDNMGE